MWVRNVLAQSTEPLNAIKNKVEFSLGFLLGSERGFLLNFWTFFFFTFSGLLNRQAPRFRRVYLIHLYWLILSNHRQWLAWHDRLKQNWGGPEIRALALACRQDGEYCGQLSCFVLFDMNTLAKLLFLGAWCTHDISYVLQRTKTFDLHFITVKPANTIRQYSITS